MKIVISGAASTIAAFASRLEPTRLRRALSVAVNDTARQTKTKTVQLVTRESSLPRALVMAGVNIRPMSSAATLEATVRGSGRPIGLKYFGAKQTARGVVAKVWGKAQFYPHAFISPALGGNVFVRQGSGRLPIHKMFGSGIAQVMAEDAVASVLVTYGRDRLEINVARQLDRYWAGPGGQGRL